MSKSGGKKRGFADTVPGMQVSTPEGGQPVGASVSAREDDTIDEDRSADSGVITSAPTSRRRGQVQTDGAVALDKPCLPEEIAREVINRRFERSGLSLIPDYRFHEGEVLIDLDGFDVSRGIGFQFLSHQDADIVSDFDPETEALLKKLSVQGIAHILVIHDFMAPTADELLQIVEGFLHRIGMT